MKGSQAFTAYAFLSGSSASTGDFQTDQLFLEVCCVAGLTFFVTFSLSLQRVSQYLPSSCKHWLANISIYAHLNQLLL